MTAGAGDRQSQKHPAHDINLVVDVVGDHLVFVDIARHKIREGEHAGGNQTFFVDAPRCRRRHQIAGHLMANEVCIRQIAIERINHPVPVSPRLAKITLGGKLNQIAGIGIPNQIQPVAAPAFAVQGRGKQPVNDAGKCLRGCVRQKGIHLGRRRWQADQVERRPSDQCSLVGGGRGLHSLPFQTGQDVPIDFRSGPRLIDHRRGANRLHGLEGPKAALGIGDAELAGLGRRCLLLAGPFDSIRDPLLEIRNLLRGEFALRGHPQFLVITHGLDHETFVWLARRGRRAAFSAG